MKFSLKLAACLALISSAFAACAQTLEPGQYRQTLKVGSKERSYLLIVPKRYNGHPIPLVMLLHGYGGSGENVGEKTGFIAKAQLENFALVLPDGLGNPKGWNVGWINLGGTGADDAEFLTELMAIVESSVKIDPKREYVCGHSNGAFMTYLMGSRLAGKVAAIGVVAGTVGVNRSVSNHYVDAPSKPVSAIIFHGKKDQTVPYDHQAGLLSRVASATESSRFWAQAIGITSDPVHKVLGPLAETDDYRDGSGHEVILYSFTNGSHLWPGGMGPTGMEHDDGLNATDAIWDFFKKHPLK